jgi:HD-GYP domain-containing protein (c-di-GMP phosphodiesterase class II)
MNSVRLHHEALPEHRDLRERLRDVGILLVACDEAGEVRARPRRGEDWLSDLLCYSPMFRQAIRRSVPKWNGQAEPAEEQIVPGLWVAPVPVQARRRRAGYSMVVVITERLLEAEQLSAMCHGAMLDETLVRSLVADLPPAAEVDVSRLITMVRHAVSDQHRMSADAQAMESVGKQLAESYEEINLLYTIIQSMTVVQRPERFVSIACKELLETLPYRWIGAQFHDDTDALHQLSGRFELGGEASAATDCIRELAGRLLERATTGTPMVIEPTRNKEDAGFEPLGRAVLVQPISRDERVIGVIVAGDKEGDDIASSVDLKLLGATATHMAIFLENAALYEDLNAMFLGTLEALTSAIDAKDQYTLGHSERVAHLTWMLARAVGLDEHEASRMRVAGLVHDVGKIGVPEHVLTKPGRLNEDEFAWIRRHPEIGYKILKDIPQLSDILPGVLHHHERWDGQGYPGGLAGEEIPLVARIIALADAFDAMSSTRTYRAAMSRTEVITEVLRQTGKQFDPALVPLFVKLDYSGFDEMVTDHHARETLRRGPRAAS